nr:MULTISPECIES: hypothetical protein [unclassified Microbacterium]
MTADRRGDRAECCEIEWGFGPGNHAGRLPDRVDTAAEAGGHHLFQLGEGGERGLFDAEPPGRRRPQPDRDGDGFVIVEQQWRHRRPRGQPVPAGDTGSRVHGIAERAELADVGAHGPRAHTQSVGECGTRPVPSELKQRQQFQQTGRGLEHV